MRRQNTPQARRPRRRAATVERLEGRALLSGSAAIDWQMAPRFAPDAAGELALPNTPGYVAPPEGYRVLLDASKSEGIRPESSFTWTITAAAGGVTVAEAQGVTPAVTLPEGTYDVRLEATGLQGAPGTTVAERSIKVDDILVVSIGDSYASGEGNPVRPGLFPFRGPRWAASPDPAMHAENAAAHRSTRAAPALFAQALEQADPYTSVTFVSLANSGATIDRGLLGPMASVGDPGRVLRPALEEVGRIVGDRPIDVMTVSIGGNDIGFSTRIAQLASYSVRGVPGLGAIRSEVDAALAALPARYAALDAAIDALGPERVLITEYPDLGRDERGRPAPIRIAGVSAISAAAAEFSGEGVVGPLNRVIEDAAEAHGWTYVGGIFSDFRTHGYPSRRTWVRGVAESFRMQHDRFGTFHPNEQGQQAIARRMLDAYRADVRDA